MKLLCDIKKQSLIMIPSMRLMVLYLSCSIPSSPIIKKNTSVHCSHYLFYFFLSGVVLPFLPSLSFSVSFPPALISCCLSYWFCFTLYRLICIGIFAVVGISCFLLIKLDVEQLNYCLFHVLFCLCVWMIHVYVLYTCSLEKIGVKAEKINLHSYIYAFVSILFLSPCTHSSSLTHTHTHTDK